jgi:tripartite-type tricarboxylate transporter receptor subunit TctC
VALSRRVKSRPPPTFAPAARVGKLVRPLGASRDPPDVQQKLNAAVTQALADAELVKKLREQGGEPAAMPISKFREFIVAESAQFRRIVETAKITAE